MQPTPIPPPRHSSGRITLSPVREVSDSSNRNVRGFNTSKILSSESNFRYEFADKVGMAQLGDVERAHVVDDDPHFGNDSIKRYRRREPSEIYVIKSYLVTDADSSSQEKPLNEIAILQAIQNHPNIIQFYESIKSTDKDNIERIHFVMDFCNLGDLFVYLGLDGASRRPSLFPFSLDRLRYLMRQIVEGVAHLHANGIAHRDLSLENVLVHSPSGRGDDDVVLRIIDLAMAIRVPIDERTRDFAYIDYRGRACGKPAYMAPEVFEACINDNRPHLVQPMAADVWSLGVILFCLATNGRGFLPQIRNGDAIRVDYGPLRRLGFQNYLFSIGVNYLPSAVYNLLLIMLQLSPDRRVPVRDILGHPFFTQA